MASSHSAKLTARVQLCAHIREDAVFREYHRQKQQIDKSRKREENRCRLEGIMEAFECTFSEKNPTFCQEVRNTVFPNWAKYGYSRDASLACVDIQKVAQASGFIDSYNELSQVFKKTCERKTILKLMALEKERREG